MSVCSRILCLGLFNSERSCYLVVSHVKILQVVVDNFGSTVIMFPKVLLFYSILTLIAAFVILALDATLRDLETPAGCIRAGLGSLELHKLARSAEQLVLLFPFPLSHLLVGLFIFRVRLGVGGLRL